MMDTNLFYVPGQRIHPTMKQLIWGTIAFLQSHPRIQSPNIFYPIVNPTFGQEEIKVQVWKTYGGIELVEPGLTIAVYPCSQAFDTRKGVVAGREVQNKSCVYKAHTLGPRSDLTYSDCATYRLIIQAYYQDATTPGETIRFPIDKLMHLDERPWPQHGFNVRPRSNDDPFVHHDPDWLAPNTAQADKFLERQEIALDISPGEEILREWMDLLRLALCDLPPMLPFAIRSAEVEAIDYPTSTLFRQPTDVFFHTAYVIWTLSLYPPANWQHVLTMPPVELGINI